MLSRYGTGLMDDVLDIDRRKLRFPRRTVARTRAGDTSYRTSTSDWAEEEDYCFPVHHPRDGR